MVTPAVPTLSIPPPTTSSSGEAPVGDLQTVRGSASLAVDQPHTDHIPLELGHGHYLHNPPAHLHDHICHMVFSLNPIPATLSQPDSL
ncbi:hypothetical protein Ancab_023872, partial [Ancistrocladus abbreviatus]